MRRLSFDLPPRTRSPWMRPPIMARRTAKQKSTPAPGNAPTPGDAAAPGNDTTPAPEKISGIISGETPATEGAALLADLEARCGSLRDWHEQAAAGLLEHEKQLKETAQTLANEKQIVTQANKQLNAELEQLAAAQATVVAERDELAQLRQELDDQGKRVETRGQQQDLARRELDEEWDSLRSLRAAQETLGHELDAQRKRLRQSNLKLTHSETARHAAADADKRHAA